jgi:hypothetical protein
MSPATNPAVELARYRVSAGERVLKGQRVLGVVRVTDVPADGEGRRYLVERELISKAELDALVADYRSEVRILSGALFESPGFPGPFCAVPQNGTARVRARRSG